MARKTVRSEIPENIDDLITLIESILIKNDGALPGQKVPAGAEPAKALPEDELAQPLRDLYPELKTQYDELVAARDVVTSRSGSVMQTLGLSEGQNRSTDGTGLNLVTRILKVLLSLYSGRENEAEGWGFNVAVGSARAPQRTPAAEKAAKA